MLCFAYKWRGDKTVKVVSLPDFVGYEKNKTDDSPLAYELRDLLDEADIVVAHNGKAFDIRKINARFLKYGITPPSPIRIVDTLLTARAKFKLNSNSQGDLCKYLGIGEKLETGGYMLWKGCIEGNVAAWNKMRRYNKQDVVLLEKLYDVLLPWDDYHPNITLASGIGGLCPRCGSNKVKFRGWRTLKSWRARSYVCRKKDGGCGRWSQGAREKLPFNVLN